MKRAVTHVGHAAGIQRKSSQFANGAPLLNKPLWVSPREAPDTYQLVELLGGGGEGDVWLATIQLSERGRSQVAVKMLSAVDGPEAERGLAQLGRLLQNITHPAVVRVQTAFVGPSPHPRGVLGPEQDRLRYVVMDYVAGLTLLDWISDRASTSAEDRLRALLPIAAALDSLHAGVTTEIPVAHGDVKPANIIVRSDGNPVLVDVGLVRLLDMPGASGRSAAYAAPELHVAHPQATPDADRWAFAATVAHALLGRPLPLDGRGFLDLDTLATFLRTSPITRRRQVLVRRLLEVLHAEPAARPRSLYDWLDSAIATLSQVTEPGVDAETDSPAEPEPELSRGGGRAGPAPQVRRRRLRLGAAGAAVAAIAIAIVAFVLAPGHPAATTGRPSATASPTATPPPTPDPNTLDWNALPAFADPGPTLYAQSLTGPATGWPTENTPTVRRSFDDNGYAISPLDRRFAVFVTAPTPTTAFVSDAVVSATATLQSGQGLWGVWCRGTDRNPSTAYLFVISHTAAIQISTTGFQDGTGWKHLDGVDVSRPVTLSARCADEPGRPVELTMGVNGKQVLTYQPATVLSPGYYGVTAQPFGDVTGPIATDTFTEFSVSRG